MCKLKHIAVWMIVSELARRKLLLLWQRLLLCGYMLDALLG
jgi:hypothetical protein